MLKKLTASIFMMMLLFGAGACSNTADGIGDDIEEAADDVEDAVD